MVTESSTTTDAMAMGLKLGGDNLVTKSLDNIVGNLWQARQESSGSSIGNQSPRNGDDEVDMMSDAENEASSPPRDSSPDETHGTVRLKDQRDLIKDERTDAAAAAFLAGLPHFPGFEAALSRHSRDFLSNPSQFLTSASSRTPPPTSTGSGASYPSYSPSNNNNNKDRLGSPSSPRSNHGGRGDSGGDNSSQNWSFEEQFKQLYEIDDNPKRKVFLDELFSLMQKRGTPINRLPIMAKQVLDLFELYNLVLARGGLVEVINKKLWQEVIKGLGLPSSITSAAFTLRTQYTKYLYPLECMQRNLSNPSELQMAIEGNKREGRRSSYGPYSDAVGHHMAAAAAAGLHPQQISAMSLVNQRVQQANATGGGHHGNGFPSSISPPSNFPGGQDPMSALEMTRLALWKMYNQSGDFSRPPSLPQDQHQLHEEKAKHPPRPSLPSEPERLNGHKRLSEDREVSSSPKRVHHTTEEERPSSRVLSIPEEEEEDTLLETRPRKEVEVMSEGKRDVEDEEEEEEIEVRESPRKVTSLNNLPGANIKIASRGDGKSKDSSLVVSMEINGIAYQGVLFAQPLSKSSSSPANMESNTASS